MTASAGPGAGAAPLEDLMVAMDVVDTVRHRELIVDRELDAGARRQRLMERLRDIYAAQGIEVSDAALAAGVDALEQERFGYTPTPSSFSARLARIYVRRDRWLKPVVGVFTLGAIIWLAWYLMVVLPESRSIAALPAEIESTHTRIQAASESETATLQGETLYAQARQALDEDKTQHATDLHGQMQALLRDLESTYDVRIVSRPNEISGVWRVPAVNPSARNYYLIVEAVTPSGDKLPIPVRNEEDGSVHVVTSWGLRVSEETFEAVAADKRDDGIIQDDIVGTKKRGQLEPEFRVPTTGATITAW